MKTEFEMSTVGELTFFLGLHIRQSKIESFFPNPKSTKYSMTPISTTTKLSKDAFGKDVEEKLYRSMIGSLLYLTSSHLDISFSVGACARY
ncbi:hypothetical protein AAG906_037817 [Vitis piasezkii]